MKMSSDVIRVGRGAQLRAIDALARADDTCDVDIVHLDAVREARAALPAEASLSRVVELLALISNPTRLKIVLALRARARSVRQGELCVCDLAVVSGASQSMTSHQLRLLRAAGIVVPRRAGKLTYYRLVDASLAALLGDAMQVVLKQDALTESPARGSVGRNATRRR